MDDMLSLLMKLSRRKVNGHMWSYGLPLFVPCCGQRCECGVGRQAERWRVTSGSTHRDWLGALSSKHKKKFIPKRFHPKTVYLKTDSFGLVRFS